MGDHPLDNPAWSALTGPHAGIAERSGVAVRYPADVSPFGGLPADPDADAWAGLAELAGTSVVVLTGPEHRPPAGWRVVEAIPGVQLDGSAVAGAPEPEAVRLTEADVPEMLDLVRRTRPGPLEKRTYELGTYLGIRRGGALVAMAGERMHPPGWTEISAVCTDPEHRGQGLAGRLTLAVAANVRARGDVPFLHTGASNAPAIRLYESLGFVLRRTTSFVAVRPDR
ncbi:GNAT family N-acetyltransferase [Pseudonocardia sp. CA-107938]|uniref:GNAT family N-acetyltransferase n=1 Tax=Pseudonocardia sp. CA-107938 TaxID=3240021 RepID=UPI003D8F1CF1